MKPASKFLLVLAITGIGLTVYALRSNSPGRDSQARARKILMYQDSMHPWIKSDQPGKCTICSMELTPIYEGDRGFGVSDKMVVLSSNSVTVLNVQAAEVKRQPLIRTLRVAGVLEACESRKSIVAAPAASRIESLAVEFTGAEVQEGQPLLRLFSPELSQKNRYLQAALGRGNTVTGGGATPDPFTACITAPRSGTVVERPVVPGQYVVEGEKLLVIVDSSLLWFRFDVYSRQLPWVAPGQAVAVTAEGAPGQIFPGVVSFVEPSFNDATRSVKVRADIANPAVLVNGRPARPLRFGMFAEATLTAAAPSVLAVPRNAILFPGASAYAYIDQGDGAYEMRRVQLGRQGDDLWEVLGGLEEGDRVVTSGNVLIDAQAQFQRGDKPEPPEPEPAPAGPAQMASQPPAEPPLVQAQPASPVPAPHTRAIQFPAVAAAPAAAAAPAVAAVDRPRNLDAAQALSARHTTRAARTQAFMSVREEMQAERWGAAQGRPLTQPAATNPPAALDAPPVSAPAASSPVQPTRGRSRARAAMAEGMLMSTAAPLTPTAAAAAPAPSPLAGAQRQALETFLAQAASISQALAADNLDDLKSCLAGLPAAQQALKNEFPAPHRWSGPVERLAALQWTAPKDLADARKQFLAFSTTTVELAKQVRKEVAPLATLKVYHCPMAPKPGLWIQAKGPLRNPFYGSEMLECGKEVAP